VARGVVRNPEHVAELERLGTQAIVWTWSATS